MTFKTIMNIQYIHICIIHPFISPVKCLFLRTYLLKLESWLIFMRLARRFKRDTVLYS